MNAVLSIEGLHKKYEGAQHFTLDNISFEVREGEILALTGESGCGKTTLLRSIAGFESIEGGEIKIFDQLVASQQKSIKAEKRDVGMVFQDLALFPHMTVQKNIAYGLSKISAPEKSKRIREVLGLTNLEGFEKRYPHELSGGQRQRVALARALAAKPKVLLMDEPFSNLDEILRVKVRHEILDILKQSGMTTIIVTHDSVDAFSMADKIAILKSGQLVQLGTPENIFLYPTSPYVARFFGEVSIISGTKSKGGILTKFGLIKQESADEKVLLGIRPSIIELTDHSKQLKGKVANAQYLGEYYDYQLVSDDGQEHIHIRVSDRKYQTGETVYFDISAEEICFF